MLEETVAIITPIFNSKATPSQAGTVVTTACCGRREINKTPFSKGMVTDYTNSTIRRFALSVKVYSRAQ